MTRVKPFRDSFLFMFFSFRHHNQLNSLISISSSFPSLFHLLFPILLMCFVRGRPFHKREGRVNAFICSLSISPISRLLSDSSQAHLLCFPVPSPLHFPLRVAFMFSTVLCTMRSVSSFHLIPFMHLLAGMRDRRAGLPLSYFRSLSCTCLSCFRSSPLPSSSVSTSIRWLEMLDPSSFSARIEHK